MALIYRFFALMVAFMAAMITAAPAPAPVTPTTAIDSGLTFHDLCAAVLCSALQNTPAACKTVDDFTAQRVKCTTAQPAPSLSPDSDPHSEANSKRNGKAGLIIEGQHVDFGKLLLEMVNQRLSQVQNDPVFLRALRTNLLEALRDGKNTAPREISMLEDALRNLETNMNMNMHLDSNSHRLRVRADYAAWAEVASLARAKDDAVIQELVLEVTKMYAGNRFRVPSRELARASRNVNNAVDAYVSKWGQRYPEPEWPITIGQLLRLDEDSNEEKSKPDGYSVEDVFVAENGLGFAAQDGYDQFEHRKSLERFMDDLIILTVREELRKARTLDPASRETVRLSELESKVEQTSSRKWERNPGEPLLGLPLLDFEDAYAVHHPVAKRFIDETCYQNCLYDRDYECSKDGSWFFFLSCGPSHNNFHCSIDCNVKRGLVIGKAGLEMETKTDMKRDEGDVEIREENKTPMQTPHPAGSDNEDKVNQDQDRERNCLAKRISDFQECYDWCKDEEDYLCQTKWWMKGTCVNWETKLRCEKFCQHEHKEDKDDLWLQASDEIEIDMKSKSKSNPVDSTTTAIKQGTASVPNKHNPNENKSTTIRRKRGCSNPQQGVYWDPCDPPALVDDSCKKKCLDGGAAEHCKKYRHLIGPDGGACGQDVDSWCTAMCTYFGDSGTYFRDSVKESGSGFES